MRLVYDHQIFHAQRYGGISRYYFELISRAAVHPGSEVALFQGFHINEYGLEGMKPHLRGYFGIKRPDSQRTKRLAWHSNRALFELFARRYAPDVYHSTYYGVFARRVRTKRVVTVYDMIHERLPALMDASTTAAKRAAVDACDHVLAISESTKRDLVEIFKVRPEKVTVTHLANSLTSEVTDGSAITGPYILYVAGRQPYKGFPTLIEALGVSPACRDLKLVCFGGGAFKSHERESFVAHGLADRVEHISGSDALLARLYKHASVFVYPSLYEGFGLPPLEAMHYGCPVIASRSSSIPEVVGDAGFYFAPGDIESLREALEQVLGNVTLRARLRADGIEQEKRFSWDRTFAETNVVYEK